VNTVSIFDTLEPTVFDLLGEGLKVYTFLRFCLIYSNKGFCFSKQQNKSLQVTRAGFFFFVILFKEDSSAV